MKGLAVVALAGFALGVLAEHAEHRALERDRQERKLKATTKTVVLNAQPVEASLETMRLLSGSRPQL